MYRPSSACVKCEFGDGIALLDKNTNEYFSLNAVGAAVWTAIETAPNGRIDIDGIVSAVAADFDITESECRSDINGFLDAMQHAKLIEAEA